MHVRMRLAQLYLCLSLSLGGTLGTFAKTDYHRISRIAILDIILHSHPSIHPPILLLLLLHTPSPSYT